MKLPLARRAAATCAIIVRLPSFPRLLPPPLIMSKPRRNDIRVRRGGKKERTTTCTATNVAVESVWHILRPQNSGCSTALFIIW